MTTEPIQKGDVVQIDPSHHSLGGCLAIVEAVKGWGIVANVPVSKDKIAPVRLETGSYDKIGKATWVTEWLDEDDTEETPT